MGVVLHPGRLKLEMARRGWSATDLARESGVSRPTISAALAGRAIAARSVGLVARAFARVPAEQAIDALIFGEREGVD
jgi:transcriptional regulator with XRE-family HTH domain